jgi:hypothetical protein
MSYYPLIDDTTALEELDRWLAREAWVTLRQRARQLTKQGYAALPPPHGLPISELVHYKRQSRTTGGTLDLTLPSFRRIANVVRRAAKTYGPNAIGQGHSPYGY